MNANCTSQKDLAALRDSMPSLASATTFILPVTDRSAADVDSTHWSLITLQMYQRSAPKVGTAEFYAKKRSKFEQSLDIGSCDHWDSKAGYNREHAEATLEAWWKLLRTCRRGKRRRPLSAELRRHLG